jgi:hypothetical protein
MKRAAHLLERGRNAVFAHIAMDELEQLMLPLG